MDAAATNDADIGTERELKFSLIEAHLPSAAELRAVLEPAGYGVGQPHLLKHRDRYYDDARASLSRAGLALRRRIGEGQVLAGLKSAGVVSGALHQRAELELPMTTRDWPAAIAERISMVTDPRNVRGVMELDTERLRYAVTRDGSPLATLNFDAVRARFPGSEQSVHFEELEIEALGQTPAEELDRIAGLLDAVTPLTASGHTKLERARALLGLGAGFDG